MSSTLARLPGLRAVEPLKITSCIDSPRSSEARDSPSTQRTASMMLDLPQPFGPTTPTSWPGTWKCVGSTNDLKPASLIDVRRTAISLIEKRKLEWTAHVSRAVRKRCGTTREARDPVVVLAPWARGEARPGRQRQSYHRASPILTVGFGRRVAGAIDLRLCFRTMHPARQRPRHPAAPPPPPSAPAAPLPCQ